MSSSGRRRSVVIVILLIVLALIALLWSRCSKAPPPTAPDVTPAASPTRLPQPTTAPSEAKSNAGPTRTPEVISDASLNFAPTILAGADVTVQWTGPANEEDYITIVPPASDAYAYDNYKLVSVGNPLTVPAPVAPGTYEVRYLTGRTKRILARGPLEVLAASASINAPSEVMQGAPFMIEWTGPNNRGDYVTIVEAGARDGTYRNYGYTEKGPNVEVNALTDPGAAEIRYVTGQDSKTLARRPITIIPRPMRIDAPATVVEGGNVKISFEGTTVRGDYITVVPKNLPDGQYGNNNDISRGSPLNVQAPMTPGPGEVRYMTAQGARILARRDLTIEKAVVTLEAADRAVAGETVEVKWSGPENRGDYITIVPANAPEGQVGKYADAERKSPSRIAVPKEAGPAEIRYISGQGRKILGRRPITVTTP